MAEKSMVPMYGSWIEGQCHEVFYLKVIFVNHLDLGTLLFSEHY
jgi:hypothetical protein